VNFISCLVVVVFYIEVIFSVAILPASCQPDRDDAEHTVTCDQREGELLLMLLLQHSVPLLHVCDYQRTEEAARDECELSPSDVHKRPAAAAAAAVGRVSM
jgi:hypothetical protein